MGIGDDAAQQYDVEDIGLDRVSRPGRIGQCLRAGDTAAIHGAIQLLPEYRQAGARAAQRLACVQVRIQRLGNRRSLPEAHVTRLISAGDEDAVGPREAGQYLWIVCRGSILEHKGLDGSDGADPLVKLIGDVRAPGGTQHDNVAMAGVRHEPAHGIVVTIPAADPPGRCRVRTTHKVVPTTVSRRCRTGREQC